MLYEFDLLDKKLDEWGFPKLQLGSGFEIIRTDFEEAYRAGQIEFRNDGIYLITEDREWKGYMYMPSYRVAHYGHTSRFHLTRCRVIDNFITSGMFNAYYKWSNSNVNDITDRDTKRVHSDQKLQLCSKCRESILEDIEDTEDFFETLDKHEIEETSHEVDIFGYDRNWQKISKEYRKKMDFTCEECGIKIENRTDQRYLHTHHKNGDKANNRISNLQCLCVLCHSHENEKHEENFNKNRMIEEIKAFVIKYRKELIKVKNRYLNQFENENL